MGHYKINYFFVHKAAAPAVRVGIKTELSYRNDKIIAYFFPANKNKNNAQVVLALSYSYMENSGFHLTSNSIYFFRRRQLLSHLATVGEIQASYWRPIF